MTFPTVSQITTSATAADNTAHTASLGTYSAGQLLVLIAGWDGSTSTITGPAGWTALPGTAHDGASNVFGGAWYLVATGSEGSTISLTTANAQRGCFAVLKISGHDSSTNAPQAATLAGGSDANPNPGSVTITGTKDFLFIAWYAKDTLDSNVTAYPTNYTDNQTAFDDTTSGTPAAGVAAALCTRSFNTSTSEDPGTFTMGESEQWVAGTIAVHPGTEGSGGGGPVTALQSRKVYVLP